MSAFGYPIMQAVGVAGFALTHIAPCVAPVVDGVADVRGHEVEVAEAVFLVGGVVEGEEIGGCGIPAVVDAVEEGEGGVVELAEDKSLVFPFGEGAAEGFVLVQDPAGLVGYFVVSFGNVGL